MDLWRCPCGCGTGSWSPRDCTDNGAVLFMGSVGLSGLWLTLVMEGQVRPMRGLPVTLDLISTRCNWRTWAIFWTFLCCLCGSEIRRSKQCRKEERWTLPVMSELMLWEIRDNLKTHCGLGTVPQILWHVYRWSGGWPHGCHDWSWF